jgi:O-acetylserine/cysteine efflux transporter
MTLSVRPLHLLLFVFVMVIWGLNFVAAKMGLAQLPPLLLMTLRFGLFAVLAVPFVKWPRERWRPILAISFTLGFLHFALMFTGLAGIDAATAAIAIQLQVAFAALLAAIFLNDKIGWRRAIGLGISFLGVALIAGEPRFQGNYLALGLVIAASFVWSVANIQIKKLGHIDGLTLNAWVAVFATPQLCLASLLLEDGQMAALATADWRAFASVLYQVVAVLGVGYGIWYWLLRQYDVNQAMPFTLLVPLVGVASGVFLLGDALTPYLIIGGLLTVCGVTIIVLRRPRVAAPEAERL